MNKQSLKAAVADLSEQAKRMTERQWLEASIVLAIVTTRDGHCPSAQVKEALDAWNEVVSGGEATDEQIEHAGRRLSVEWWSWLRR